MIMVNLAVTFFFEFIEIYKLYYCKKLSSTYFKEIFEKPTRQSSLTVLRKRLLPMFPFNTTLENIWEDWPEIG